MKLDIITAHCGADCMKECVESWGDPPPIIVTGMGMLEAYEQGWRSTQADIIAHLHDDVLVYEKGWRERVLKEFDDPSVGLCGFGGGLQHGSDDIYKVPYNYRQLGRSGYLSNVNDAEVHGQRFDGVTDAAVLDGYCLIVRRSILEKWGGWIHAGFGYIGYDYALCCETHRQGYRIRVVGIRCHHLGGRSVVGLKIQQDSKDYDRAHEFIYQEYKSVLPWRCI